MQMKIFNTGKHVNTPHSMLFVPNEIHNMNCNPINTLKVTLNNRTLCNYS